MFKEVQQQTHGSRVGETLLTSLRTHGILKENEEYSCFSKFTFTSKTKWQFQVVRETRTREWRRIKSRMKNKAHLPKLGDSRDQEYKEPAGKKKKNNNWTTLPQALISCKKKWRDKTTKDFFSSQRPISYGVGSLLQGFVKLWMTPLAANLNVPWHTTNG